MFKIPKKNEKNIFKKSSSFQKKEVTTDDDDMWRDKKNFYFERSLCHHIFMLQCTIFPSSKFPLTMETKHLNPKWISKNTLRNFFPQQRWKTLNFFSYTKKSLFIFNHKKQFFSVSNSFYCFVENLIKGLFD